MKGIILAGGSGTRLYPLTKTITKQLLPIYDKPMIYYPLSFLMLGGVSDIFIISTSRDLPSIKLLLGSGEQYGINISYAVQDNPNGIPEAFKIAEDFIGTDDVCLILGDNLFQGDLSFFRKGIQDHIALEGESGRIFAYSVSDPERYGVIDFDKNTGEISSIEEKPSNPKSNYAIPGLYIFDSSVIEKTKRLTPSVRGETEIVDIIRSYHSNKTLHVTKISRGIAWLDTGTPKSIFEASMYISAIEERQGLKIACLEEIAFRMHYISSKQFNQLILDLPKSPYRNYLEKIQEEQS